MKISESEFALLRYGDRAEFLLRGEPVGKVVQVSPQEGGGIWWLLSPEGEILTRVEAHLDVRWRKQALSALRRLIREGKFAPR